MLEYLVCGFIGALIGAAITRALYKTAVRATDPHDTPWGM